MSTAYLSLGSNVGDPPRNIEQAIAALDSHGAKVVQQSRLYETEPVEMTDQAWFVNCVVEVQTHLSPEELMSTLLQIERGLGRERRVPKGPRVIDIDILLFDSQIVRLPGVEIPHPRMADRRFVLVPMAEIAPEALHPVLRKTIAQLAEQTEDRSKVRPLS